MATYNKFHTFLLHLAQGEHDFRAAANDVFRIYLTNTLPDNAAHTLKANVPEFAGGSGYTANGEDVQQDCSQSGGQLTVTAQDVTWTAGGAWSAFQWIVLFNDVATTLTDPLVAWWAYSGQLIMANGDTFRADFGTSLFTIN
jgi:hypothetical protein